MKLYVVEAARNVTLPKLHANGAELTSFSWRHFMAPNATNIKGTLLNVTLKQRLQKNLFRFALLPILKPRVKTSKNQFDFFHILFPQAVSLLLPFIVRGSSRTWQGWAYLRIQWSRSPTVSYTSGDVVHRRLISQFICRGEVLVSMKKQQNLNLNIAHCLSLRL